MKTLDQLKGKKKAIPASIMGWNIMDQFDSDGE